MSGEKRFNITRTMELPVNPFTDEFLEEEIDFYGLKSTYQKNGVRVRFIEPAGRLDDYLNKNWRIPKEGFMVPALVIDGRLWMSLTYMEIQSAYIPISVSGGVVGTAGLGLGYFALRAAALDHVDRVEVFERESRVVDFFMDRFKGRREMKKIRITFGDAREKMLWRASRQNFDVIFMDVYQTLLGPDVIKDIRLFQDEASVQEYRFWGQERVLLDALMAGERPRLSFLERAFFKKWRDTEDPEEHFTLPELYEPMTDAAYRRAVLEALGHP